MTRELRRLQNATKQATSRLSAERDRIDKALFLMATRLGKTLTAERINLWHVDLASYPVEAIEYACDCWGRNAKTLPAPSDFTELLKSWMIPESKHKDNPGCSRCDQGWVIINPAANPSYYKMAPCKCLTNANLRKSGNHPPLSAEALKELRWRISELDAKFKISQSHFPNGNPRYNHALVQARALMSA